MRIHDSSSHPGYNPKRPPPPPADAPMHDRIVHAIKQVYDPEIPVNIYDLGLIYDIKIDNASGAVDVTMTLTTPHCPEAQSIPEYVKKMVETVDGITEARVRITWEPMWTKDMMSEDAKLVLGMI